MKIKFEASYILPKPMNLNIYYKDAAGLMLLIRIHGLQMIYLRTHNILCSTGILYALNTQLFLWKKLPQFVTL